MPDQNSLHSEYDLIGEALDDAICNGDGRPRARHLLVELEHRGLKIIPVQDAEPAMAEQGAHISRPGPATHPATPAGGPK